MGLIKRQFFLLAINTNAKPKALVPITFCFIFPPVLKENANGPSELNVFTIRNG